MASAPDARWDRVADVVVEAMQAHAVPGVAAGVLYEGELAAAGFGVTNVEHPLDVTATTLFQIGSITKTFTGTLVLRLVELGKIELDATVRTYLPAFRVADAEASEQVTVRHLLTHMGGWEGDHFVDTGAGDDALPNYVASMADLEQLAPLNTHWSYNNAGFSVAGAIIEKVTGKSYQAALREFVLDPLGLQQALLDPGDVITHRFAVGHSGEGPRIEIARPWPLPRAIYPAGGLSCGVRDLLAYARFHMDAQQPDAAPGLSRESLEQMQTPQVAVWGNEAWGITWSVNQVEGVRMVSHGGGTNGQISLLLLIPERRFAVAVLTNAGNGGRVTTAVSRAAIKEYLGITIGDPQPIEVPEEQLRAVPGRYSRPFLELEIGLLAGRLVAQAVYRGGFPTKETPPPPPPPPASLAFCEEDRLLVMDGPLKDSKADIVRRSDGSIGWIRTGGRLLVRRDP